MNIPPILISAEILDNKEIISGYFLMKLNSPELASRVVPGQFFDIRVEDRLDIILRRPFSIFDYDENSVSILYEVAGKGTKILSKRKLGEGINILGPLGNGFMLPMDVDKIVLTGGGIGIAPLYCWAKELLRIKKQGRNIDILILIGAKNRYKMLCEKDFKKIGLDPETATDDGSYGYKGFVIDLLRKKVGSYNPRAAMVYGCGPNAMLKELAKILTECGIKGQLSLDRHMGCGMGVCLGCVVKIADGRYKRVCKDGPIFKADEVAW